MRPSEWVPVVKKEVDSRVDVFPNPALPVFSLQYIEVGVIPKKKIDSKFRLLVAKANYLFPQCFTWRS
jgi:hypothetical protein